MATGRKYSNVQAFEYIVNDFTTLIPDNSIYVRNKNILLTNFTGSYIICSYISLAC